MYPLFPQSSYFDFLYQKAWSQKLSQASSDPKINRSCAVSSVRPEYSGPPLKVVLASLVIGRYRLRAVSLLQV